MIASAFAFVAALALPDSSVLCVARLRDLLLLARARPSAMASSLRSDSLSFCRGRYGPPGTLGRRLENLAASNPDIGTSLGTEAASLANRRDTVRFVLRRAPDLYARQPDNSSQLSKRITQTANDSLTTNLEQLSRDCDSLQTVGNRITQVIRDFSRKCIANAIELLLRQGQRNLASVSEMERNLWPPLAVDPEAQRDTLLAVFVSSVSSTAHVTQLLDEVRRREAARWDEEVLGVERDLEALIDRRPTIVPFLTSSAQNSAGGGLLLRFSTPTWSDRTPWIATVATFPSGTPLRQAGEVSVGRFVGDLAVLAGVVGRQGPQPVGVTTFLLFVKSSQAPIFGVRLSTTDPVALMLGWGFASSWAF